MIHTLTSIHQAEQGDSKMQDVIEVARANVCDKPKLRVLSVSFAECTQLAVGGNQDINLVKERKKKKETYETPPKTAFSFLL